MNYEYENKNKGGVILSLIIKMLIVIAIIFLLLWLFPTKKSLNPLFEEVFRNNINSMKDAAETYFTNERLPKEVGESVKISLKEMLDKKLLLPFVDRYDKECDLDKSYVKITKMETEYEMEVNLVCSKEEASIIEHMGCTDKCSLTCGKEENKKEESKEDVDTKDLEYEFKKVTTTKEQDGYTCKDGYTLNGKTCTKNTKKYSCPSGYTLKGTTCEKVEKVQDGYSCPSGYTLNGTTCTKTTTRYSCPSGYTLKGTTCEKVEKVQDGYSCPSGYTLKGTKCERTVTSTDTVNATLGNWVDKGTREYLLAEASYDASGNLINKTVGPGNSISPVNTSTKIVAKVPYANGDNRKVTETRYVDDTSKPIYETYYYEVGSVSIKECSKYKYFIDTTTTVVYTYTGGGNGGTITGFDFISCGNSCTLVPSYYTNNYSGATAIGKVGSSSTSSKLSVTCDYTTRTIKKYAAGKKFKGYEQKADGRNVKYYVQYNTQERSYTCPSGYSLSGNKCNKTISSIETINATIKYIDVVRTVDATASNQTLTEPATIKYKDVVRTVDATVSNQTLTEQATIKYKYTSKTEYKWSTSKSLSGWTRTGRTRSITSK